MVPESDSLDLEQRLATLLEQPSFAPPEDFVAAAALSDAAIYAEAGADSPAWWAERALELDWFEPFTKTLDDSAAPFYKWFEDGKLNAERGSGQFLPCASPDSSKPIGQSAPELQAMSRFGLKPLF